MNSIDCRGLNCPEPVVKTKNELDRMSPGEKLIVTVDNQAAKENVVRLATGKGCVAVSHTDGDDFVVTITKGGECDVKSGMADAPKNSESVLFVKSATIGTGNDELGRVLMNGFLNTVSEYENPPKRIFFVNGGVTLTVKGADTLDSLLKLEKKGAEIFSCGTCLDYYGLKEELAVGSIGNMYDLVDNLFSHNVVYI